MNTIQNNKCIGSRYNGERLSLSSVEGWHGKFGHFNLLELDHDSVVTGKGQHDRVMVTLPRPRRGSEVYIRVDHVWGLGMPSEKQMIKVMKKDQDIKGKWQIIRKEVWDDLSSTDVFFGLVES